MCVLRPTIVSVIGASDLILLDQSPYVASFTRPIFGEPDAPGNGVVVKHQLEFLHFVEHLELREPLAFLGSDICTPDLTQRQRLCGSEAPIEKPVR